MNQHQKDIIVETTKALGDILNSPLANKKKTGEMKMKAVSQTVRFDDEGSLQDALAAKGIGAQSIHDDLKRMLDDGTAITIEVPGMPPRALVRKSAIEKLVGTQIQGTDLVALPFA